MLHAVWLFATLLGVWLLLSGFFDPFFLTLAVVSCIFVIVLARRMDVIDHEGQPVHLSARFAVYIPWLAWQIVCAAVDVLRRIVSAGPDIDPVMRWLPASQRTDLGTAIYANSITLTPGTVSVTVERGRIEVHALSRDGMVELEQGEMDRRVRALEG